MIEASSAFGLAWAANTWASVYPLVTGLTAALAMFYMLFQVIRLIWRWMHGYPNFLSDGEAQQQKEAINDGNAC